ncbi:golgin subfamily A member 6-like protein 1 [Salvia splendens]|uniref:golgin subfamily A member 6-like protein 1 n=1 Tax=Salvia splendens TaxID=180675 RepID=UPI001C262B40|nr:golgin subfamily A member 6-like protein 1 [Salvia splendens]
MLRPLHFAMFNTPLKLSVSRFRAPRFVLPNSGYVIGLARTSEFSASLLKTASPFSSIALSVSCRAVRKNPDGRDVKSDPSEEANATLNFLTNVDCEDDKETQTDKSDHGNKGRIPWNKGRKHSEETRARISRNTKEALKDPKIRKKMSEAPRVLSNQTKVKIRASLTKLWGRRLRSKRSREKFLQSWRESIALAAKKGGADQQELEWDSYEKFKQEAALEKAEEAKRKELARVRKDRAAKVKAALKTARLAQKKREREEKAEVRQEATRKRNKWSKEEKEKMVEFQGEKLKERLMKIQRKKSIVSRVSSQQQRRWEKFDLDLAEGKHLQKDISLADQIRIAKKRRAELLLLDKQDLVHL